MLGCSLAAIGWFAIAYFSSETKLLLSKCLSQHPGPFRLPFRSRAPLPLLSGMARARNMGQQEKEINEFFFNDTRYTWEQSLHD